MNKKVKAEYIPECNADLEISVLKDKIEDEEMIFKPKTIKQEDDSDAITEEQKKLVQS